VGARAHAPAQHSVRDRRDEQGNALNRAHRREYLLSGLLACGCCGGRFTIVTKDRYGCAVRRGKGTCMNGKTIDRRRIEARVLSGLKDKMLSPSFVEEFVRTFAEEMATLARASAGHEAKLRTELADVERRLQGVMAAIEAGAFNETLRGRLDALRGLLDRVALRPDPEAPDGLRVVLYGDLAEIMALGGRQHGPGGAAAPPNRAFPAVAGGVNCRWLRGHATQPP
jgi:hypothetical protein